MSNAKPLFDMKLAEKIKQIQELTGCSRFHAALVLKDSKNDLEAAVEYIFDSGQEKENPLIQDITRCSADETRKALKFTDNSLDVAVTKLLDDMVKAAGGLSKLSVKHVKSDHMPYAADENQNGSKDGVSNIRKTITLLLLGETGVGKSTLINAFANYLMHETLEDAMDDVQCLIPCHFTLIDKNYKQRTITLGQFGVNEGAGTGSATQTTKCYEFDLGRQKIRIIDTPGIGDTRGVDVYGTNMRNLLDFISQYKEINAICILLKRIQAVSRWLVWK